MTALLILVAAAGILAGVGLDRMALRFLRPPRRALDLEPVDLGLGAHEIEVPGEVRLKVWIMGEDTPGIGSLVVLVHGWGATSSGPLRLAPDLVVAGHTVASVDVRGHGRSAAGPFVTLRHFRDDLERTIRHLKTRFPEARVSVVGHSMGGAAGILVAADGGPIDRLVTVAAPYDLYDATRRLLVKRRLPANWLLGAFRLLWRRRIGVPYSTIDPGPRAREVRIPVLVIQPMHDRRVPVEHGERLAKNLGTRAVVIDEAGHSDVLDRPEVHELVTAFLDPGRPGLDRHDLGPPDSPASS